MKTAFKISVILFILLFPVVASGQIQIQTARVVGSTGRERYVTGYFIMNSAITSGVKVMDGIPHVQSRLCREKRNGRIIEYTPEEVQEYGYQDGTVYVAREILLNGKTEWVFLEKLVSGDVTLFQFRDKGESLFFLNKEDEQLQQIPVSQGEETDAFRDLLSEWTADCQEVHEDLKYVHYNRPSLAKYVSMYNSCDPHPFPRFRYGVNFGTQITRDMVVSKEDNPPGDEGLKLFFLHRYDDQFQYHNHFNASIFIDAPIKATNLSIHADFGFTKLGYSYTRVINEQLTDLVVKNSTLEIPLQLRYTIPHLKIRPFVNGGVLTAFHIQNYSAVERAYIVTSDFISDFALGATAGAGVEIPITHNNSLFLEARYLRHFGITGAPHLDRAGYQFTAGISF
ncbi:MAG: hypothetical protein ABFS10_04640 [Bacteroidota bacterium]